MRITSLAIESRISVSWSEHSNLALSSNGPFIAFSSAIVAINLQAVWRDIVGYDESVSKSIS